MPSLPASTPPACARQSRAWLRRAERAWAVALTVAVAGCAFPLQGGQPEEAKVRATVTAPAAGPPAGTPADPTAPIVLDIQSGTDMPPAVRGLLEQHLDLARLERLGAGTPVGEAELDRLVQAAPAQVGALLATEGYFGPRVTVRRSVGGAGAPVRVGLDIELGVRATVERVALEATGALRAAADGGDPGARRALATLRARWTLPLGDPFRSEAWTEAKSEALMRLRAEGYALARWVDTRAEVAPSRATVRLRATVDAGPLLRTGAIAVEGLRLHEAQTVRNLAGFETGTPATEALLLDFQDRLLKTGLFARAAVTLDSDDTAAAAHDPARADAITVRVEVAETTRHELTTGLGISANTGPRVTTEHIDRRFLGRAATVRNHVEWARSRQAWDGEVATHPGPTMARWLAGGTVERLVGSDDVVLSQRVRAGWNKDAARLDRFTFVQVDRSARKTDTERSSAVAVTGNQHLTWRRLDNPILPTEGYTLSVQAGLGQAWDSADLKGGFGRLWSSFQLYRPLGRTWFAQARVEAGQVFAPDALEVPEALRFRAGGDDSVRGYAYRSLGPIDGTTVGSGNVLVTGSIELARPLSAALPQFWGAVFVDAGRAAQTFDGLKPALGYGVGLRWRSPVGPLRLDLAHGEETGENRLHFSLGIAF